MKGLRRKLIIGLFTLGLLFTCLTTTTYAWFARNTEAWTDDMNLELEYYDGIQISVDGINFKSNINESELKKAIVSKTQGIPVTSLNDEKADELFKAIQIKGVTTNDLNSFYTIDSSVKKSDGSFDLVKLQDLDKISQENPNSNPHYYAFDLYFRMIAQKIITNENNEGMYYDLIFKPDEEKDDNIIKSTYFKESIVNADVFSEFNVGDKHFKSGDKIGIDLRNAIRVGVKHNKENEESLDEVTIFEPYMGLGSYPIEGEKDSKYDPSMNYMLNHLKAYSGVLNPIKEEDKELYKNTEKDFNGEISLGRFIPNTETDKYKDVKITVYIWLEGYDSDYLSTVDNLGLSFKLSFRKKEGGYIKA